MFNSTWQQGFLIPNWLGKQRNIGETTISTITALWNQVRVRVLWLSGCDSTGHTSVWLTARWSQLFKKHLHKNVFSKYKPWHIWPGMLWHISTFSRETSTYLNNWLKLNNKKQVAFHTFKEDKSYGHLWTSSSCLVTASTISLLRWRRTLLMGCLSTGDTCL